MGTNVLEVEIFSYCNRKCHWCPNSTIDRSGYTELDRNVYTKLLIDLKDTIDTISFSRYNEPMSHLDILIDRISIARRIMPDTKLVLNTNGDFLTTLDIDIDELTIMDYDCNGIEHWIKKLSCLGAMITLLSHSQIRAEYESMLILVELNWSNRENIIEDRGGLLRHDKMLNLKNNAAIRSRPCYEPISFIGVDYSGDVVPCCHIRSDAKAHSDYILGNLYDTDINTILNSKKRSSFILDCIVGHFTGPCLTCQKDPGRYTKENGGIYK